MAEAVSEPLLSGVGPSTCLPVEVPFASTSSGAAMSSSLAASVHAFDFWVSSGLHSSTSRVPESRHFLRALEHSGDGLYVIPAVILLFLNPWETSPARRQFWLGMIIALILDLAVVGLFKALIRRPRPSYNRGDMAVVVSIDKFSFPSGHASRAFLLACIVTSRACVFPHQFSIPFFASVVIARDTWVKIFDTWALATAASRILLGRHYFLDVVCGCLVGYVEASITLGFLWPSQRISEELHLLFMQALAAAGLWTRF